MQLDTPTGPIEDPSVAYAHEPELKWKKEIKGGLAELQKRGVKITSYNTAEKE